EVAAGNPWPADFQLTHGLAIAGSISLVVSDTHIHKRQRPTLLCPDRILLFFRPVHRLRVQAGYRGLWRGLRHSPGMNNVKPVMIKVANQALWRCSAAAQDAH